MISVGINSADADRTSCVVRSDLGNVECSSFLDTAKINDTFVSQCRGKKNCVLDFKTSSTATTSFWKSSNPTCQNNVNFAFVQYSCEMQENEKFFKYRQVTMSVFCVLMISILFVLCIWYIQHTVDLGGMQYDVSTIVASDYTVEMDITDDMWREFEDNAYSAYVHQRNQDDQMSKVLYFKQWLHDNIKEILSQFANDI